MRKYRILAIIIVALLGVILAILILNRDTEAPSYRTARAELKEIRLTINTNGIIEPVNLSEIYAPIDGVARRIPIVEGSEVVEGQALIEIESAELRVSLAEARTSLLQAKRQAKAVEAGSIREEITVLDASIAEAALQLDRTARDLQIESALLEKGAVAQTAVEALRKERDRLQLRVDGLKRQREDILERYTTEDKDWERQKIDQLSQQVASLERQIGMGTVRASRSGVVFALDIKPGAYVTRGQLLARINQPGRIRLRAYVDEPDLGRIAVGQPARIGWDGMADRHWNGTVERPAEQVVSLNNRTVGHVLCAIEGTPAELIPNLNVKVEITTERKANALTVPRSAVFSREGRQAVLVLNGPQAEARPVTPGLVTSEEIEILEGIQRGDVVVINPLDSK